MEAAYNESVPEQMSLQLKYRGPAVDDGTMDVYEVASNMVAFSNYVVAAAHEVYGADAKVTADVKTFTHGSFETDLLFHIVGVAGVLLGPQPDLSTLLTLAREALSLFLHLGGEAPKRATVIEQSVHVENRDGEVVTVNIGALNLYLNPTAGGAVGRFIGEALAKDGVDSVEIHGQGMPIARVPAKDAPFYRQVDTSRAVTDTVVPLSLQIEQPGFRENLKWRFSDGESSFAATIEDMDFVSRVDNGEPFRKGDVLRCDVRIVQTRTATGELRTSRTVVRVTEHEKAAGQANFFGDPEARY